MLPSLHGERTTARAGPSGWDEIDGLRKKSNHWEKDQTDNLRGELPLETEKPFSG